MYSFPKCLIVGNRKANTDERTDDDRFQDHVMIIEHMLTKADNCISNIQRTREKTAISEDDQKYIWKKFTKMRVYVKNATSRIDRLRKVVEDRRRQVSGENGENVDEELRELAQRDNRLDAAIRTSRDVAQHFFAVEHVHMKRTRAKLTTLFPSKTDVELEDMMLTLEQNSNNNNVSISMGLGDEEMGIKDMDASRELVEQCAQQRGMHPNVRRELMRAQEYYGGARNLEHGVSDLHMIFSSMLTVVQANTEHMDSITLNIDQSADCVTKTVTELKKGEEKLYTARRCMCCSTLTIVVAILILIMEIL